MRPSDAGHVEYVFSFIFFFFERRSNNFKRLALPGRTTARGRRKPSHVFQPGPIAGQAKPIEKDDDDDDSRPFANAETMRCRYWDEVSAFRQLGHRDTRALASSESETHRRRRACSPNYMSRKYMALQRVSHSGYAWLTEALLCSAAN